MTLLIADSREMTGNDRREGWGKVPYSNRKTSGFMVAWVFKQLFWSLHWESFMIFQNKRQPNKISLEFCFTVLPTVVMFTLDV